MKPDIFALLDQIEDVVATARSLPIGGRVVASRDQLLDLIDAIRGEIPSAVIEADRINRDRVRIVEDARRDADQILERARDQAAYLAQEHTVMKSAELEAERLLNRAREDATQVTSAAERYALDLFARLEEEALRLAADIRKAAARRP